jgi:hypothetical protein
MTALDAYKNVLRELDKFESPDFDPGDFSYWWNTSTDQYVNDNYADGDILQKNLDDIRILLSDANTEFTQDGTDKTKFALPSDYLHLLNAEIDAKALVNYRRWKKDQVQRFELKRERTAKKGLSVRNTYDKAGEDNPKYRIVATSIYALIGEKFEPVKLYAWYIKKPLTVVLGPLGSDYNDPAFNSVLQFPDYVCREIVKVCKINVLENIESQRTQSSLALEQLQKK